MPLWINEPEDDAARFAYRIIRTPAEKPLTAIVTSLEVIGTNTHFVNNRTVPCEGQGDCKWHDQGYSWRWHGYLAAMHIVTSEHFIFEFTAPASKTFKSYLARGGTIRGCKFTAYRPSKRFNGRVVIACSPIDQTRHRIPEPPDVAAILCHIWNVKTNSASSTHMTRPPFPQLNVVGDPSDGRNRPLPKAK